MRRLVSLVVVVLIAIAGGAPAAAVQPPGEGVEGSGRVVGVIDGDTIDVLVSAETAMELGFPRREKPLEVRFRLDQVDTPERGMPWGTRARQALAVLVQGRVVRFVAVDVERYARDVVFLFKGDTWDNAWLIEQGHGWAYRRYAKQGASMCSLENQARTARRCLWSQPPNTWQPPWLWRKRQPPGGFVPSLRECLNATRARRR